MNDEPIRVVIDTQLYLRAAANLRSLPARIIFDSRHKYQLIASDAIVAEVEDVLNRPKVRAKFPQVTDEVVLIAMDILKVALMVNPDDVPAVSRDPKDDIFLACAFAANAHYIVTEDQDLLVLNPYEGISIINAADFWTILQGLPDTPEH